MGNGKKLVGTGIIIMMLFASILAVCGSGFWGFSLWLFLINHLNVQDLFVPLGTAICTLLMSLFIAVSAILIALMNAHKE
ncbi:hypothetical protein C5B42_03390 [Candidatus Cerribacteria bacterium 'Amazon FNV 2010 28 9']|uniref:Uncharacterized protein n=1 Tax=Candidatus Cerribacteria bacterium 'Amazon FNV 2010 28 9' TaxID=2081795 RepID=A0A317JR85_9BACT|nr:MAG: hypothetical protein C5B42_03390 [Candidatus Cerribacteria bacterium 'Amazon FNV 2010 28 9']